MKQVVCKKRVASWAWIKGTAVTQLLAPAATLSTKA